MNDKSVGPVRDLVGCNGRPPKVVWPNDARLAVSVVVNFKEGSERAVGDGDAAAEPGGAEITATSSPRQANGTWRWSRCTSTARGRASGAY